MYLCPKDTNCLSHFDELLLFCFGQKPLGHSLILFELTPESLKSEKGSKIKPTPYVQWSNFDDFSALYEKGLSTVFT